LETAAGQRIALQAAGWISDPSDRQKISGASTLSEPVAATITQTNRLNQVTTRHRSTLNFTDWFCAEDHEP